MKNFIVANGRWVLFALMAYLLGGVSSAWSMNGAYRYYIPLFRASYNAGTGIGLSNLNPAVHADIAVSVYGLDGASIGAESKTIPAGGQDAFVVGPGLNADGHMVVGSSQPLAGVCFISEQSGAYMADVPFSETLSTKLTLPHVAQSQTWETRLYFRGQFAGLYFFPYTRYSIFFERTGQDGLVDLAERRASRKKRTLQKPGLPLILSSQEAWAANLMKSSPTFGSGLIIRTESRFATGSVRSDRDQIRKPARFCIVRSFVCTEFYSFA